MAKKLYLKPNAEYIVFYSEEEIAASISLDKGMEYERQESNGMGGSVTGPSAGGSEGPGYDEWD